MGRRHRRRRENVADQRAESPLGPRTPHTPETSPVARGAAARGEPERRHSSLEISRDVNAPTNDVNSPTTFLLARPGCGARPVS